MRAKADASLPFFEKFLWHDVDLTPEYHFPLLYELQEIPRRWLTCEFRGSLKSSRIRAAMTWVALGNVNWSWLLVMNRYENAEKFLEAIDGKFKWGPTAGLLQEVYKDRLQGFKDWTKTKLIFTRTDANAQPFLNIAGLDSALESIHVSGIVMDDLEGADEDKAKIPSEQSRKFVFNRAEPLLIKPEEGPLWVSGTPHGDKSLVWAIRDLADAMELQDPGNDLNWRYRWKEVLDNEGNSRWPQRMSDKWIRTKQISAQMDPDARRQWDQQYMLRRRSASQGSFNMEAVESSSYELKHGRLCSYPSLDMDPMKIGVNDIPVLSEPVRKTVDLAYCRSYCHIDAQHKDPSDRAGAAGSLWAILIVYVAPDMHSFLVDWWIEDASFDAAVHKFFQMYRKHAPQKVTIDAIGAQIWLRNYIRLAEKTTYKRLTSLPTVWNTVPRVLSRPSRRTFPAEKENQDKESYILQQLEGLFNLSWLHIPLKAEKVLEHLRNIGTGSGFLDAADALAQGPSVWDAPISQARTKAMRMRQHAKDLMSKTSPLTGYRDPWNTLSSTVQGLYKE